MEFKEKENLKIAVACENGEVVKDLGQTEQLMLFDTQDGKILKQKVVDVKGSRGFLWRPFCPKRR